MPGIKTAIFTNRIVIFHETFAPLGGKYQDKGSPAAVIWHEAIAVRTVSNIPSAIKECLDIHYIGIILILLPGLTTVHFSTKIGSFFTFLVIEVNTKDGSNTVSIKFLEKGHTFTSADALCQGGKRNENNEKY